MSSSLRDPLPARTGAEVAGSVRALSQELIRHSRILHMVKARLSADSGGGLDSGALSVLLHVVKTGGLRQRDLAECAMLDPSTISRHVGLLVRLGHVARQADQEDGRAVRLVATDSGRALHAQLAALREGLVSEVLSGWSDQDLDALTALLRRLNDDFESLRPQLGGAPPRHPVIQPFTTTLPTDQER